LRLLPGGESGADRAARIQGIQIARSDHQASIRRQADFVQLLHAPVGPVRHGPGWRQSRAGPTRW